MCVISVHAGIIKRSVSNPIHEGQWVFIPFNTTNDTWIPIPYHVLENQPELRKHFQLVYMQSNGVLSNETLYPARDKTPHELPLPFIGYVSVMLLLLGLATTFIIIKLMQKRNKHKI